MKAGRTRPRRHRGLAMLGLLAVALTCTAGMLAAGGSDVPGGRSASLEESRLGLARAAYLRQDAVRAEKLLRDHLKDRPEDREARSLLGRVLRERGRLTEARETFESLLKADAKDVDALRGLAQVLRDLGQPQMAARHLQAAVAIRMDDPSLWKELGLAQREAGDYLGALSSIQRSLSLDRDQMDLSLLLSELAAGKPAEPGLLAGRPRPGGTDLLQSRSIDPSSLLPGPKVLDPSRTSRGGIR